MLLLLSIKYSNILKGVFKRIQYKVYSNDKIMKYSKYLKCVKFIFLYGVLIHAYF